MPSAARELSPSNATESTKYRSQELFARRKRNRDERLCDLWNAAALPPPYGAANPTQTSLFVDRLRARKSSAGGAA
jgi:hypothetical protein